MKAGAVEFRTKPGRDQQLLEAVQQARDRDRLVRQQCAEPTKLRRCDKSLTQREREVMTLVVTGPLNRKIAAQLRTSTSEARSGLTEHS